MDRYIKTIVADDDTTRAATVKMACECSPWIELVAESNSCKNAFHAITEHKPQLVIISTELADGNGFDLLKMFPEIPFKFIVVTSDKHYAVEAFRLHASDYLLKPFIQKEFEAAIRKVIRELALESELMHPAFLLNYKTKMEQTPPNLVITNNKGFTVIQFADIILCEANAYCTNFYLVDSSKITSSYNLKHYESLLPFHRFIRVHNSFIINKEHVKGYTFQNEILLNNNLKCPLSTRHKHTFLKSFGRLNK